MPPPSLEQAGYETILEGMFQKMPPSKTSIYTFTVILNRLFHETNLEDVLGHLGAFWDIVLPCSPRFSGATWSCLISARTRILP